MSPANIDQNGTVRHWLVSRTEPSGAVTVQVVGVPELHATAATRNEAVDQIRAMLAQWLATDRLIPVEVPTSNPLLHFSGHLDANDPLEKEFVEELARLRREDLERTLQEEGQECSGSSSTPTT